MTTIGEDISSNSLALLGTTRRGELKVISLTRSDPAQMEAIPIVGIKIGTTHDPAQRDGRRRELRTTAVTGPCT